MGKGAETIVKRSMRLHQSSQFQRVRREGRTLQHRLLLLNVARNRTPATRCGIVVTRRIGKAVQRNRARRRVREAVRLLFDHIAGGVDMVFVVRHTDVISVPFGQVQAAVQHLLQRAGIWRETPTGHIHATRASRPA